jgi:RNA polymerase sigma-70 factor (ECF subfamily)
MYACISKMTSSARFEGLCARYRPDVFRFALWLARDGAIAEDVVQETFLRAWRAIDSLADPEAARSWLLTIARREHARLHKRKRHTTVPLGDLIANDDPALASVPSEDNSDIGAAISSLDTDYRKPLVLQVLMGYSTEEIARQMGLTRSAVLSRLYRARLKLRVAPLTERRRMVTKRKLALVSAVTSTIVLVSTASQPTSLDALLDPPHHAAERPTDDATPRLVAG